MIAFTLLTRKATPLLAVLAAGCSSAPGSAGSRDPAPMPAGVQAISFLGDTLRTLPLTAEVRTRYEAQLSQARTAYERTPSNVDSIIWYARRLAYLGRLRESIDVYSRGVALYPDNPWLYRHRGHRYISVRELDRAISDLERAAKLVEGKPDVVEPDGQPNARNQPIGTLHSNIAYHLALAYYLNGDYAKAIPIYRREIANAKNDDRRVSTAHWLYMSLRRLGRDREAADLLTSFHRNMEVIENQAYHRLMLLYKGELPVDSVLTVGPGGEMSVTDATAAYGVGNWHLYNGRRAEADRIFRRIIAGGQWGAFGYIAAETELKRVSTETNGETERSGDFSFNGLRLCAACASPRLSVRLRGNPKHSGDRSPGHPDRVHTAQPIRVELRDIHGKDGIQPIELLIQTRGQFLENFVRLRSRTAFYAFDGTE